MTKEELSKMVYTEKTITMLQDGLGKVIDGLTSFEEIFRIIEIETNSNELTAPMEEVQLNKPAIKAVSITPISSNNGPQVISLTAATVNKALHNNKREN